jgi:hypothetical protein
VGCLVLGCTSSAGVLAFPPRAPLWRDDDRHPFAAQLEPYYSPHDWDRFEKSFVRPVSEFFAMRPHGEARNVNAVDEVPDSSWFENRLGRLALSAEELAAGPCIPGQLDVSGPWTVVGAKPDGATPGFVFETRRGQRYVAKVDGTSGSTRASVADVLGSRIYHAAGYRVPCYAIVYFDASVLKIEDGAEAENEVGQEIPLTPAHLGAVLGKALRAPDGRHRAAISVYLEGRPLGPWRYHGLRRGDRNDIIQHEDRRELRASRLLAAWTDHGDQREGNTLSMWRETDGQRGYVMHHLIDFSDCFGSIWGGSVQAARRRSHDYWIDPRTILADFFTLGLIERPWDREELGPLGLWLGYYAVDSFDPEGWRSRYPNPAFVRMTERDAAWMARIIARLTPSHLEQMLDQGLAQPELRHELQKTLLGRRRKILERYLLKLSPLANPTLRVDAEGQWLCATDLSVTAGVVGPRSYRARFLGDERAGHVAFRLGSKARPCVLLPKVEAASRARPAYLVLEVASERSLDPPRPAATPAAIRFHLYTWGRGQWLTAGIERLDG